MTRVLWFTNKSESEERHNQVCLHTKEFDLTTEASSAEESNSYQLILLVNQKHN